MAHPLESVSPVLAGAGEWTNFGEAAWFQWEEDPEGKRHLFNDYHARLALAAAGDPGATGNLRDRVHEALKITSSWQAEHSGLPLGCHAELVESWYQYLNWMLLSFAHTMGKLAACLLDHIEEHQNTQTWLLEPKEH